MIDSSSSFSVYLHNQEFFSRQSLYIIMHRLVLSHKVFIWSIIHYRISAYVNRRQFSGEFSSCYSAWFHCIVHVSIFKLVPTSVTCAWKVTVCSSIHHRLTLSGRSRCCTWFKMSDDFLSQIEDNLYGFLISDLQDNVFFLLLMSSTYKPG